METVHIFGFIHKINKLGEFEFWIYSVCNQNYYYYYFFFCTLVLKRYGLYNSEIILRPKKNTLFLFIQIHSIELCILST